MMVTLSHSQSKREQRNGFAAAAAAAKIHQKSNIDFMTALDIWS